MTGPEIRRAIADTIAPSVPDEWTVYPAIPEVASLPAVIVANRNPYRAPSRFDPRCITYGLQVRVLEARSAGVAGYDSVDDVSEVVRTALLGFDGLQWIETEQGEASAPGGVDCVGAVLNLTLET